MIYLWNTLLYKPLLNLLVFLVSVIPGGDLGIALILLTILVRIILFPLSKKSIESQVKLKNLEPEINKIKELYPTKEEQAKKTFELYKQYKVNPFSGCLLILLQLPIIFALYHVFFKGLSFSSDVLYSFIQVPAVYNTHFLGLIDMSAKSIVLALLAGITQYIQISLTLPKKSPESNGPKSFKDDLMKSMNFQMKYLLPVFIAFVAYQISAAIALYWVTSNVITIIQEIVVRKRLKAAGSILEVAAVVKQ
ncbi:MAG: YidC/Oxa1 family membrane protein insertase [Candidatus Paceibacterota bacterium]|jgi:YidC/Oxa1 family membrane protein insertase